MLVKQQEQLLQKLQKLTGITRQIDNPYYSFPLTNYWIASSHNTYLTQDQLIGPASVCTYLLFLNTFKGGCVEIDPGYVIQRGVDNLGVPEYDVSVTHVLAQTGKIWLSDLLHAIQEWTIINTDNGTVVGPVILSIDNKKIKKVAEQNVIWSLFDKYLNISRDQTHLCYVDNQNCSYYLNPESLKDKDLSQLTVQDLNGKIIIKWAECTVVEKGQCADPKAGKGVIPPPMYTQQQQQQQQQLQLQGFIKKMDDEIIYNLPVHWIHMPQSKCKLTENLCPKTVGQVTSTHKPFDLL